jgi:hypothetical protein
MTFLEELQAQTGLLGNQIRQSSPFATYTPTSERTIQGVPQNYFDPATNQFMMPEMTGMGGTMTGVGTGTGTAFGTYTPGAFGQFFGSQAGTGGLMGTGATGTTSATGGGGNGRPDPVNPTAYNFPNYTMLPGLLGVVAGLVDLPQGTKFKYNEETGQYEPEAFVNKPEGATTWNPEASTMTMDQQGNVTYGTDPYGIGDYTAGTGTGSVAAPGSLMGSGMVSDNITQTMTRPGPLGRPSFGGSPSPASPGTAAGAANIQAMAEAAQTNPQVLADIAAMTGTMPQITTPTAPPSILSGGQGNQGGNFGGASQSNVGTQGAMTGYGGGGPGPGGGGQNFSGGRPTGTERF